MPRLRIGIVGCGTAGPAAAIYLKRLGHDVVVFEAADALRPVGAGLLLQPTGARVLEDLGVFDPVRDAAARVDRLFGRTVRGRTVMELEYAKLGESFFGLGVHRGVIFQALRAGLDREGVEVKTGIHVGRYEHDGRDRCTIYGAHGERATFDLVIAADGARSALGVHAPARVRHRLYPWGAVWCAAHDAEARFTNTLHQVYDGTRRMIGFLPVGNGPEGDQLVAVFWSLAWNTMDDFRTRGVDAWKTEALQMEPRAEPLLEQVNDMRQLISARYVDTVMRTPIDGRVVFLGDAAHAMSPQLGQGVNLALLDARELSRCLETDDDVPTALAAYARRRRKHVATYQLLTRWLTPWFQSGWGGVLAGPRDLLMGPMCRVPWARRQMLWSLAGVKRGLLGADLDLLEK